MINMEYRYYDKNTNDFVRGGITPLDIHTSLAQALNIPRDVAKTAFYMRVFDAGPGRIGHYLVNQIDTLNYATGTMEKTPYETALENLGVEAIKIIERHISEMYKMQFRESCSLEKLEKPIDKNNNKR